MTITAPELVQKRLIDPVHLRLLDVFRRLPRGARRFTVRRIAPSYTVGAIAVITDGADQILLIRQSYRELWGLPGGLLKRGEDPQIAVQREVREEIGIDIDIVDSGAAVVDLDPQRIDLVFPAMVQADCHDDPRPTSPEITEVSWFHKDALPPIQIETETALAAMRDSNGSLQIVSAGSRSLRRT